MALTQDGDHFVISIDGRELMSSRDHRSEQALAELGCAAITGRESPRVLIGGLGMGFTLRAALDQLPAAARVVVAEIVGPVAEWCRGPLAYLNRDVLRDPRVDLHIANVADVMRSERFDAILLDVDNGPQGLTRRANHGLYTLPGLTTARRSLTGAGVLAVWSAAHHPPFAHRLERAAFASVEVARPAGASRGRRARPVIYLARAASAGSLASQLFVGRKAPSS